MVFSKFSCLPTEIRLKIWELALSESTTIKREWNNSKFCFSAHRTVPAVLQACSESRLAFIATEGIASRPSPNYELIHPHGYSKGPGLYVDWRKDTLWIHRGFGLSASEIAAYSRLQGLMMDWGLRPCWLEGCIDKGVRFIKRFIGLEALTLVVKFNEHGWTENDSISIDNAKQMEIQRIGSYVRHAFLREQQQNKEWKPPQLRVLAY